MDSDLTKAAELFYREVWRRCAAKGWCDEEDGAEFRGVLALWMKAGYAYDVWGLIKREANVPPPATS